MCKKIVYFILLFCSFHLSQAQTEEELDALLEEMDSDTTGQISGEEPVYNKLDVDPKPHTSMTEFYSSVNNYIKENYPENESKYGRVYVDFVVEKDGKLTNFNVQGGLTPELNKIAINAIKSYGNWIPGKKGVVTVRSFYSQPIMFSEDLIKK